MLRRLFSLAFLACLLGLNPTTARAEEGTTLQLPCLRDELSAESTSATAVCGRFVGYVRGVQVGQWFQTVAANERAEAVSRANAGRGSDGHRASTSSSGSARSNGRHYSCPEYASNDNPSGDFAVPCYIIGRESHGNYSANNPSSSAQGAYQIMGLDPNTPPAEQDAIARGMDLCNWNPPNYCAGG